MDNVTGSQVRAAMLAANIVTLLHHDCSICGQWTSYQRHGEQLYYCSGCGCGWSPPDPRSWDEAAHWINMQTDPAWRVRIAAKFGLADSAPAAHTEG